MTRTGKIARLPRYLRDELNRRLEDGEPGPQLLAWLNECPAVQEVLQRDFGGRRVSEQNLSEWRQGGFREWQRHQDACDHVRRLTDQSEALDEATENTDLSARLATVFAVELFKVLERVLEKDGDDETKLSYLREALRETRLLRRGDHSATRLQIEMERWERQCEREDEENREAMQEKSKHHLLAKLLSGLGERATAEQFGGGELGAKLAAMFTKIICGEPLKDPPKPGAAASNGNGAPATGAVAATTLRQANPTQSN